MKFNNFINLIKKRKSSRRFKEQDVNNNLIEKIIYSATYAPTSCNQQGWNFVVIKSKETKERLINEAGSNTLIRRVPAIIVVSYDGWNYKEAIQAGSLAVQNILLAATSLGIGCIAMNSYGNDEIIKKILKIPKTQTINCFVALGYPTKEDKKAKEIKRRPLNEVLHYEQFNKKTNDFRSYNPEKWSLKKIIDYQEYYCRKTFPGKEMDISHKFEKVLVNHTLKDLENKKILDILSYDGCYLKEFPKSKITSTSFGEETMNYTKEAVNLYSKEKNKDINFKILNIFNHKEKEVYDTATIIYKLERLPKGVQSKIMEICYKSLSKDGELIIIARQKNVFYEIFYKTIIKMFGDDVRKTGIYAFFGGYNPINQKDTINLLEENGFKVKDKKSYFFFPAFLDQAYQMYLQYKKSGGSSYLHRNRHKTFLSNKIESIIKKQGLKKSKYGNVIVIRATK